MNILMSPTASYVIAIPAAFFCAALLVAIGLWITRVPRSQIIRRHIGPDTYWSVQPEQLTRSEGVLHAEYIGPRHARPVDDEDTVVIETGLDLEAYECVGRRGADSPVRHQLVPQDWMPPVGDIRVALLTTPTAEYLFARKPKDQLSIEAQVQPRMVRGYMTSNLVQSW